MVLATSLNAFFNNQFLSILASYDVTINQSLPYQHRRPPRAPGCSGAS